MRFALAGLLFAVILFAASGGHLFLAPLFLLVPMGVMLARRERIERRF